MCGDLCRLCINHPALIQGKSTWNSQPAPTTACRARPSHASTAAKLSAHRASARPAGPISPRRTTVRPILYRTSANCIRRRAAAWPVVSRYQHASSAQPVEPTSRLHTGAAPRQPPTCTGPIPSTSVRRWTCQGAISAGRCCPTPTASAAEWTSRRHTSVHQ
jgi:hypothetical protein